MDLNSHNILFTYILEAVVQAQVSPSLPDQEASQGQATGLTHLASCRCYNQRIAYF